MKNLILLSAMFLAGTFAFGQNRFDNDPSYSVHNYKHPNKAAYAQKYKKDKSLKVTIVSAKKNDNYKQTFSKAADSEKAVMKEGRRVKTNRSYKHPYGL
jgi:hypothetical protein